MNAWVVKEWRGPDGKLKRERMAEGGKAVQPGDQFVVEWYAGKIRKRKKFKTQLPDDARATNAKAAKKLADKHAKHISVAGDKGELDTTARCAWSKFRTTYEGEYLPSLAEATNVKVKGIFDKVESVLSPQKMTELNSASISRYEAQLRKDGMAEQTIRAHLAHLKSALRWAVRMGMMAKAPVIEMPKRSKTQKVMKGRPITGEEFDRMLAKVGEVVGDEQKQSWVEYLNGLWWSGLRLAESLELYWDRQDRLCVDLSGKRPMLRIPAAREKGNQDRLLPIAPEFARLLLATPHPARCGRVFRPHKLQASSAALCDKTVSRTISAIGEKAGVKVNTDQSGKVKFASAHDLRRSFGERWSSKVMPQVLMELMRHEAIDTTMKYYVGRNAQNTAEALWEADAKARPQPENGGIVEAQAISDSL